MCAVVLVEGVTDRIALEAVAGRLGLGPGRDRDRPDRGSAGDPASVGAYEGREVAGLCDVGEERWFRRVLGDATYVCVKDLEDELIRALGAERVQEVIDAQGELDTFRNFQNQLFWRGRPVESQLRRWLQNGGRQHRYPPHLVEAMEPDEIPRPLVGVLAHA
jgi:hypothetical protein